MAALSDKYPRDILPPRGLPPGWTCTERQYLSGSYAGNTYTRFSSQDGKHKHLMSVAAVVKQDALDKGDDPEAAMKVYERKRTEHQEEVSRQSREKREAEGKFSGERREAVIQAFRKKCGRLDTAVVQAFPGWMTRFDWLPSSGQVHVTYRDPNGNEWTLLKDIEAMLGGRLLAGEDVPKFVAKAKRQSNPIAAQEAKAKVVGQLKLQAKALEAAEAGSKRVGAQPPAIVAAMKARPLVRALFPQAPRDAAAGETAEAGSDKGVTQPPAKVAAMNARSRFFPPGQRDAVAGEAADAIVIAVEDDEEQNAVKESAQPPPTPTSRGGPRRRPGTPSAAADVPRPTPRKTRRPFPPAQHGSTADVAKSPLKVKWSAPAPKARRAAKQGLDDCGAVAAQAAPPGGSAEVPQRAKRRAKPVEPLAKRRRLPLRGPMPDRAARLQLIPQGPAEEGEDVD